MNNKRGIKYYYDHLEEFIIIALLVVMTVLVFIQVILRYIFNTGIMWSEELARYLFVWLSWLGLSLGTREHQHIAVEMVTGRLKGKLKLVTSILSEAIVIAINVLVVYEGARLCMNLVETHKKSAALKCSMVFFEIAIPVGCALMIIRNIENIAAVVRAFRAGALDKEDHVIHSAEGSFDLEEIPETEEGKEGGL